MMFKPPLKLAAPSAFATPSIMNDSPEARAEFRRNFAEHALVAVKYLGAAEAEQIVHDIAKGRQGNTPKDKRNARILAEWKECPHKKRSKFAREYCERNLEEGSGPKAVRAVRQQLNRLLDIEERQAKEKAEWEREFQEAVRYRRGKSFLGSDTK
jgi:hypothetical protein